MKSLSIVEKENQKRGMCDFHDDFCHFLTTIERLLGVYMDTVIMHNIQT